MLASLLGASIGVPYVVSHTQRGQHGGGTEAAAEAEDAAPSDKAATAEGAAAPATIVGIAPAGAPPSGAVASLVAATAIPLEGTSVTSPQQVLRFDVTKEWVYRTWPRKTTGPTDVGLQSVRVPLVTGTQVHDLAGSLTYFFNSYGQVEHISFRGRTGDTRPLVQFLAHTYEFQRQAAPPGEQLYQVKRTGRLQSELRTRSEAVLKSDSPHSNFAVELELARPGSRRLLPEHGLPLAIPAFAASTASASSSGEAAASDAAAGGDSYLDNVRFATPDEEGQVQRMRWPN